MAGEFQDVLDGDFAVPCSRKPPEKRSLQFREEERELVYGVVAVVIRHQLVEPRHQMLDVDEPFGVLVALRLEQFASLRQPADFRNQGIIPKIVHEQRRVRDKGAGEPGACNEHMARSIWFWHGQGEIAGTASRWSARRNGAVLSLLPLPLPSLAVGGGFAHPLDTTLRPSALMLAFAAFQVRGNTVVDHPVADLEPVLEGLIGHGNSIGKEYGFDGRGGQPLRPPAVVAGLRSSPNRPWISEPEQEAGDRGNRVGTRLSRPRSPFPARPAPTSRCAGPGRKEEHPENDLP